MRDVLALLINQQTDMAVVGQAGDDEQARACIERVNPCLVVVDVSIPGGGVELTQSITRDHPEVRILALSRHMDQGTVRRMLGAGAAGYLVKKASAEALLGALRAVMAGGTYIDPLVAAGLVARAVESTAAAYPQRHAPGALSKREEAVLRQIAAGKSNKEAAYELSISVKTAEGYRATGLAKLKLRTRTDVIRYAFAQGWLADQAALG